MAHASLGRDRSDAEVAHGLLEPEDERPRHFRKQIFGRNVRPRRGSAVHRTPSRSNCHAKRLSRGEHDVWPGATPCLDTPARGAPRCPRWRPGGRDRVRHGGRRLRSSSGRGTEYLRQPVGGAVRGMPKHANSRSARWRVRPLQRPRWRRQPLRTRGRWARRTTRRASYRPGARLSRQRQEGS